MRYIREINRIPDVTASIDKKTLLGKKTWQLRFKKNGRGVVLRDLYVDFSQNTVIALKGHM